MKNYFVPALMAGLISSGFTMAQDAPSNKQAAAPDHSLYEMRVYFAPPGKLDELHARFRNHTVKLFEKHGMKNIGYWVPLENPENKLIYILAYPDREARDKSWKNFAADPDWQKAWKASEVNGKLVQKVEVTFMKTTDYSPQIKTVAVPGPKVFELRTYTTPPGRLDHLHARFRDHTVGLFSRHGMNHVGYWVPAEKEKGAENTLIYILSHKSREAAQASFTAFRQDPDWIQARKDSEEKAGGSLTVPDGVKSLFLSATDYSPIR